MTTTLDEALTWAGCGIAVIPLWPRGKRPAIAAWREYQGRLPTFEEIYAWFERGQRNLAVVCGWQGLTVLDFDDLEAYNLWHTWALSMGGEAKRAAQETYRVLTRRGVHVYVRLREPVRCLAVSALVQVKGLGGYVAAPPSVHESGHVYRALALGAPIVEVARLAEVFPASALHTEQPPAQAARRAALDADPWQVATELPQAVDLSGGGSGLVAGIRERVSILDLLPGARPKSGDGRWWVVRCPFHDDHEPSMWIDAKRGICSCYKDCTPLPLDVINLYARLHGLDNRTAIFELGREVK